MNTRIILKALVVVVAIAAGSAASWGATIDLTTKGASGSANGAFFCQYDSTSATGTGTIDSFVRLQAKDAGVEQGYNTDAKKPEFDDVKTGNFTHSIKVSDIPTVISGGVTYWQFLLDVGEGGGADSKISLDELKISVQRTGDLNVYADFKDTNTAYDLGDNWIKIDGGLVGSGNGRADMLAYIPVSSFGSDQYLYLYSKFGVNVAADNSFEEWAYGNGAVPDGFGDPPVPEPATLSLLVLGGIATLIRRRNRRA